MKGIDPAVFEFGKQAHEDWRDTWDPERIGKPRLKDEIKGKPNGVQKDINVPFEQLHPSWQKENIDAGYAAKEALRRHPNDLEKASSYVHDEWMKRNPKEDYNAHLHVPYNELPEDEKDKDRRHVQIMKEILDKKPEAQTESAGNLIQNILSKKLVESKQDFSNIISAKVKIKLDEMRKEIAKNFLGEDEKKKLVSAATQAKRDFEAEFGKESKPKEDEPELKSAEVDDEEHSKHIIHQLDNIADYETPNKEDEDYEIKKDGTINKHSLEKPLKAWKERIPEIEHVNGETSKISPEDAKHISAILKSDIKPEIKAATCKALHASKDSFDKISKVLLKNKPKYNSLYTRKWDARTQTEV